MMDNENNAVFYRRSLARTATEVPDLGTDGHADIGNSSDAWNGITNPSFINNLSGGQKQNLVLSADHFVQAQHNQTVKIWQAQSTTARLEMTISSAENQIHVNASTQIVLQVGRRMERQVSQFIFSVGY